MATMAACEKIGMPECRINLAHLVAYLSEAPKSTRAYTAYKRAEAAAKRDMTLPVPLRVRNAPTALMREMGCGEGYRYNPDYRHPVWNQFMRQCLFACMPWRWVMRTKFGFHAADQVADEVILKSAEDEEAGKTFDEEALREWEERINHGDRWEGRDSDH
jgi:putative ATPase